MCIYDASWQNQFGFCCDIDEELARELASEFHDESLVCLFSSLDSTNWYVPLLMGERCSKQRITCTPYSFDELLSP